MNTRKHIIKLFEVALNLEMKLLNNQYLSEAAKDYTKQAIAECCNNMICLAFWLKSA